jgi:hypothetical protein
MVAPKAQAPYPDAKLDFLAVLRFHAMDTEVYTDSAPRMPLGQSSLSLSKVQSGGMSEPHGSHVALLSSSGSHVSSAKRSSRLDFPTLESPISKSLRL